MVELSPNKKCENAITLCISCGFVGKRYFSSSLGNTFSEEIKTFAYFSNSLIAFNLFSKEIPE
jgi:hypothetical protein